MDLNILPKKGLGQITFGMPIETIISIIGQAQDVECIDNAADESTTVLHYDNGLTLFCEGDSPTLSCIDLSDDGAMLFGHKVFNMKENEIVQLMVKNNFFEQDADMEDWGERRITFNEANIDFYFDEGELTSIILGK